MKAYQNNSRFLLLTAAATLLAGATGQSAAILKLDNVNALTDPASWSGGVAPADGDIAQFDGATAYSSTNAWPLGAATAWSGIQVLSPAMLSPTNSLTIQNDGNALTLGAAGIDMSLATANLTLSNAVILAASQPWVVASGQTNKISGAISDGGSGFGITNSGAGTVILAGANTFSGGVTLSSGILNLNSSTAPGSGPLTILGGVLNNSSSGAVTLANNNPQFWNGDFTYAGSQPLTLGNGAVTLSAARNLTINNTLVANGAISGPGSLNALDITKSGGGTLTLGAPVTLRSPGQANTVVAGTLNLTGIISGPGSLNALDITKSGNGVLTLSSPVTLRGSGQTNTVVAGTMNVNGSISDGSSGKILGKAGAGTLGLYGTNTFTGPTLITGGSLTVGSNGVLNAASTVIISTNCSLTVAAGGTINGPVIDNATNLSANCTVNGTVAGNITLAAGAGPASPNANAAGTPNSNTGWLQANGGASISAGGYITNNGTLVFNGTNPITMGTIISTAALGGIQDKYTNVNGLTFTFPAGTALSYFQSYAAASATLQVAGNGSAYMKFLGYFDAANMVPYTNTFNGGTWTIGYLGQNNSSCHFVGIANLTGGATMTVTNNANYVHGTYNVINGSLTFLSNVAENHLANNFGLNFLVNNSGGGSGYLTVTNGGLNLGLIPANNAPENNSLSIAAGGTAYIKGNLTLGTTTAQGNTEVDSVNLSGGQLVVNGSIVAAAASGAQDRVFNWTGGQLTATTITTSSGFNDPVSAIGSLVVSNTSGILAPGGSATPGKIAITGGYVQTAGGTLAVDIGGTTVANTYTNLGAYYDTVAVSGSGSVAGLITANLINGYTPSATSAFTVLSAAGGLVASPGNLGFAGYIPVSINGVPASGKYFQVLVAGNNLILTNYGVSVPALSAKFSPTNTIGVAPVAATFLDSSTGIITNRFWSFGDGGTTNTTATTVAYTYNAIGTYTNVLTVTDVFGNTSSATGLVHATAAAVNLTWQGGLAGNAWNTSTLNWLNGSSAAAYADPDYVTFDDTGSASPAIALNTIVQPSTVTFNNNANNYTITGTGQIAGGGSITLAGTGSVTLLTTNSLLTGPVIINSGSLQVGNGVVSGSIDGVSAITDNGALVFNQSNTHSIGATMTGNGSLTKLGAGTLILSADNSTTFTGPIAVDGGTLAVANLNGGSSSVSLEVSNATLQVNSGGTLNQTLTLDGTNDTLNLNGTLVLQNPPAGTSTVTLGGGGTLQIDAGGTSVSLPTNAVLNGGSLAYYRSDQYAQPGVVSANSLTSSILNYGTSDGYSNTVTTADGINVYNTIENYAAGALVLNGSPNSTNIIGGGSSAGTFGIGSPNTEADAWLIINGGYYNVTNAPLFVQIGGGVSPATLEINNGTLVASYYGAPANADGGGRFIRSNVAINGGLFHVSAWGLAFTDSSAANPVQTFTLTGGTVLVDDTTTTPGATASPSFYGYLVGTHDYANNSKGYYGNAAVTQTGGNVIVAGSQNNNLEMGCPNNAATNKTASYTLAGGSLTLRSGTNSGNVHLGGSPDGASTATFILTNTGVLSACGRISGYPNGAAGSEVFSFLGGTLIASNVDVTYLSDVAGDPTGTLVNNGGNLSPGGPGIAGRTLVTGNYSCAGGSALAIDINGASPATAFTNSGAYFDIVAVTGTASLNGSLIVNNNNFTPAAGGSYTILSAASLSGSFTNVTSGRVAVANSTTASYQVLYTGTSVVLTNYQSGGVNPSPASITTSLSGGNLVLTWPTGQGWVLQAQTNTLATGLSTNWVRQTGANSPYTVTPNTGKATVFYRLVYP